jgi:hypothetical protein
MIITILDYESNAVYQHTIPLHKRNIDPDTLLKELGFDVSNVHYMYHNNQTITIL